MIVELKLTRYLGTKTRRPSDEGPRMVCLAGRKSPSPALTLKPLFLACSMLTYLVYYQWPRDETECDELDGNTIFMFNVSTNPIKEIEDHC